VQVLKTYLRAVQELAKLQQQPDVNLPLPEECQFPWLEGAINEVYDKWEGKIWSGNLKPKGIALMVDEMVAAVLQAVAAQASFASQPQAEAPAQPEGCVQSAPMDETHQSAIDSLSTECSGLSTQDPSHEADDPNPKSKIQNPKSPSHASLISPPEAPTSGESVAGSNAATSVDADTFALSPPAQISQSQLRSHQEKRKREAPPSSRDSVPGSLAPNLELEPCSPLTRPQAPGYADAADILPAENPRIESQRSISHSD